LALKRRDLHIRRTDDDDERPILKIVHAATARRSELEGSSNIAPHTSGCETTAGDRHTREVQHSKTRKKMEKRREKFSGKSQTQKRFPLY
jgi:hypothetical protein